MASSAHGGRHFLTASQLVIIRLLVVNYVVTLAILLLANMPTVGASIERAQLSLPGLRWLFAIMGVAAALTFFLLLGLCLYHYSRGHVLGRPATGWLWVILLLNFLGIILYYALVIEVEGGAHSGREVAT